MVALDLQLKHICTMKVKNTIFALKLHICNCWQSCTGCTCALTWCRFTPCVSHDNKVKSLDFDFVRVAQSLMSLLPTRSTRRECIGVRKNDCPPPPLPIFFHFPSHFLPWIRGCRLIGVSVVPSETGADYFGPSSVWFDGHWWRLSSLWICLLIYPTAGQIPTALLH